MFLKMSNRRLLNAPLFLLNVMGLNPLKYSAIKGAMALSAYGIFAVEFVLPLVFQWQGLESLDEAALIAGLLQVLAKLGTLIIKHKQIAAALHLIENHFWKTNAFGEELQAKIDAVNRTVYKIMMAAIGVYQFAASIYFIRPLVLGDRTQPLAIYYPSENDTEHNFRTYLIVYLCELGLVELVGMPGLLGFDLLVIVLIVQVINELKIIKHGLANVKICSDFNKTIGELDELIEHHNLVLQCIKLLDESYSLLLLNQFFTSLFALFLSLLNIIAKGFPPEPSRVVKSVPYLTAFTGMLFLYCFCGTVLINESEEVADAAYNSKWWRKTQPEFRRRIAMVIQRAQKTEKLTAGGMFDLKLSSFASVVRTAFSFLTLAQAVLMRNSEPHKRVRTLF